MMRWKDYIATNVNLMKLVICIALIFAVRWVFLIADSRNPIKSLKYETNYNISNYSNPFQFFPFWNVFLWSVEC